MISEKTLRLAVDFHHVPGEKKEASSRGVIYFSKMSDVPERKPVKSLRVQGRGHEAFHNGFNRK
jgi:hypothetical protein